MFSPFFEDQNSSSAFIFPNLHHQKYYKKNNQENPHTTRMSVGTITAKWKTGIQNTNNPNALFLRFPVLLLHCFRQGIRQIRDRQYFTDMEYHGIKDITLFGIAFSGKKVSVKIEKK